MVRGAGVLIYGWDNVNEVPVKLICSADGKLIIDPSDMLENPPTSGETAKAPQSDWAYDHWKDTDAHHTKYTDTEADTRADGRITAQKAQPSGLASLDASSKVVQNPANRLGVANLEFTLNKLLKGAGAGADPTEIDVPSTLTVAETEVFNGTSPTSWTDLDLSATIGANAALVLLKIYAAVGNLGGFAVRKNGDTDEFYNALAAANGVGCALAAVGGENAYVAMLVATDSSGVIEWITQNALTVTVDIIAYIK